MSQVMEVVKPPSALVENARRDNRRSIKTIFAIGIAIGILLSYVYWKTSPSTEKLFHMIVIFGASGVTIPMFLCTMRLMLKGYYLSLMGWESTDKLLRGYEKIQKDTEPIVKKVEAVMDKAVPIASNIEEIVSRAKGMSDEVEKTVHKISSATEAMNGSLNASTLIEVRDSLRRIADVFSAKPPVTQDSLSLPEFDPLKPRRERQKTV